MHRLIALFVLASITAPVQAGFMGSLNGSYAVEVPTTEDPIYHDDKGNPETKQEQPASIFWEEYPDELIDRLIDFSFVWAG